MINIEDDMLNEDAEASKNNEETKDSSTGKDPNDWITGNEPMTGAQRSYLRTLSDEAGEDFDGTLTKAEAAKRIEVLQQKTGKGLNS